MKVYVASSWRNPLQIGIVHMIRAAGIEVYDFRNPAPGNTGFSWSQCDPAWVKNSHVTPARHAKLLSAPIADQGFAYDMDALNTADAVVLVLPCGKSAHLELGYAVGAGKRTAILQTEPSEPELMYKMCDALLADTNELLEWLGVPN